MDGVAVLGVGFYCKLNLAAARAALEHIPATISILARRAVDEVCKPSKEPIVESVRSLDAARVCYDIHELSVGDPLAVSARRCVP